MWKVTVWLGCAQATLGLLFGRFPDSAWSEGEILCFPRPIGPEGLPPPGLGEACCAATEACLAFIGFA